MKHRWMISGLLLVAVAAHADVQVSFVKPDSFIDIKNNHGFRDTDVLKDIEAHLVDQAQKHLPGRDVRITVTDVDLAGDVEPFGRNAHWVRVMRRVTLPSLSFDYEVLEGGKTIQQGKALLRDMNYQDGFNNYFSSEPLRHEKRMIDRWFKEQFGTTTAATMSR